jgi:hypothetical protein
LKELRKARPAEATPAAIEDPPRPLGEIIGWLGVPAAYHVTLSKPAGGASATLEAAQEMADRLADKWAADVPGKSLLISRAEYEALKRAGAEDEVPDRWWPCE